MIRPVKVRWYTQFGIRNFLKAVCAGEVRVSTDLRIPVNPLRIPVNPPGRDGNFHHGNLGKIRKRGPGGGRALKSKSLKVGERSGAEIKIRKMIPP
jgi:hypothetical protein